MRKKVYICPEFQIIELGTFGLLCTSNNSQILNSGSIDDDDAPTSTSDGNGGWCVWGE